MTQGYSFIKNMSELSIYLISLRKDENRRNQLASNFCSCYDNFILFDAVDGRALDVDAYYAAIESHFKCNKSLMTPGEVGCALSHVGVLEQFLKSNKKFALIIEDDVIGTDEDLGYIEEVTSYLDDYSILICGGQLYNHLTKRLVYGKRLVEKVYEVADASKPYVSSTCCYVVSRNAAERIIKHQKNSLTVADDWSSFFGDAKFNFYFANILQHPQDQSLSNIEAFRSRKKQRGLNLISLVQLMPVIKKRLKAEIFRMRARFDKRWKNLL